MTVASSNEELETLKSNRLTTRSAVLRRELEIESLDKNRILNRMRGKLRACQYLDLQIGANQPEFVVFTPNWQGYLHFFSLMILKIVTFVRSLEPAVGV